MRKVFGVILILLALFLTLSIFLVFIQLLLNDGSNRFNENAAHKIGYFIGTIIGMGIIAALNFALYFFGLKLLKSKSKLVVPISDEDFPRQLKV